MNNVHGCYTKLNNIRSCLIFYGTIEIMAHRSTRRWSACSGPVRGYELLAHSGLLGNFLQRLPLQVTCPGIYTNLNSWNMY